MISNALFMVDGSARRASRGSGPGRYHSVVWPVLASIASAAVAALSAILVAIYSARRARDNQKAIENLKADLEDQKSAKAARREYEFHARQRLYEEYEPLRFQLLEAVGTAKCQIETMSEQALDRRRDYLGATPTGNYWLLGTIYHLLHPAALFRITQRRLTLVDLRIEPTIHREFVLAKKAYLALSHDARVAEISGLPYTPYVSGWREKRLVDPAQFRRQGLPLGRLDNAVDTLIVRGAADANTERIATFGEFEKQFGEVTPDDVSGPIGAARDLFDGFNPGVRPVLWRILLAQFVLYKALLASITRSADPLNILQDPWAQSTDGEKRALGIADSVSMEFDDVSNYLRVHVIEDVKRVPPAPAESPPETGTPTSSAR